METHRLYCKHRVTLKPGVNYVPIEFLRSCGILPWSTPMYDHQENRPTIGTPEEAYAVELSLSDAEIERLWEDEA